MGTDFVDHVPQVDLQMQYAFASKVWFNQQSKLLSTSLLLPLTEQTLPPPLPGLHHLPLTNS
jgi:hypothetical protein